MISPSRTPLPALEISSDEATRKMYREFNATVVDFPIGAGVPSLVREQARRSPDALAVCAADRRLTYRQLDERVDQIAGALRAAGCPARGIVALMADRSADFVAGMLAIMRADGVYLPIDPCLPQARKDQILRRSQPSALLVDRLSAREPAAFSSGIMALRLERPDSPLAGPEPPAGPAGPDDPAYVIFTSGSTGTPKGALVHHAGLVNHLSLKIAELGLGAADRLAQNAPQSFDISIWQMLAPLLVGGSTHILTDEIAGDPFALAAAIAGQRLTVMELVPSMLTAAVSAFRDDPRNPFGALRAMVVGGEELPPQLARDWFTLNPSVPLVNVYGPTECSDDVSHAHFTGPPDGTEVFSAGLNRSRGA